MAMSNKKRGFTLIELMIVVAILGILAAVAIAAYRAYIEESHNAEATSILADIRLKQEAYRGTFHQYAKLNGQCDDWVPRSTPTTQPAATSDISSANCAGAWRQLGVSLPVNLYFVYDVEAGNPNDTPSDRYAGANPASNTDFWYGGAAIQDLDGDSACAGFRVISGNMAMLELAETAAQCTH